MIMKNYFNYLKIKDINKNFKKSEKRTKNLVLNNNILMQVMVKCEKKENNTLNLLNKKLLIK